MRPTHLLPLALLLFSPPTFARVLDLDRVVEEAQNTDLKNGLARYADLDFAEGIKGLEQALVDRGLAPVERAAAALYAGLMAHSLDDVARAKDFFTQALEAVPDLELPPEAAPKDRALFEEMRSARRAQAPEKSDPVKLELDWANEPMPSAKVEPVHQKWWFWTGIGAVVVSGTVAAVLLTRGGETPACGGGGRGCIDVTISALRWRTP